MAVRTAAVPPPSGATGVLRNRWFILLFSVISMVAVANLQYGWTLFVTPLSKQLGQDATLIQVGAYGENWPDIHMTPEDGVTTHLDVRGGVLIPVHWCTFVLAFHGWAEPIDRIRRDAKERGVTLAVPRPGERVDVDNPPEVDGWWQSIA